MIAECDAFSTLQFLLQQSPWAGGLGWDTLEEQLREAFNLLPIDEGPLAEVLIETIEETHQDKTTDGVYPNQRRYDGRSLFAMPGSASLWHSQTACDWFATAV
jgi:hypothetical protein